MTLPDLSATRTTPRGQKNDLSSQSGEMVQYHRQKLESEDTPGYGVGRNLGALRATSGRSTKRLKSRVTTRAGKGKSAQAVIKLFRHIKS